MRFPALALLVLCSVALAASLDPRGWSDGPRLQGAQRALTAPDDLPDVAVPKQLTALITGETLVFYYAPTCPHCQRVAREVGELARRQAGKLTVVGVASKATTDAQLAAFAETYGFDAVVPLIDADRSILSALQVRSTPSAVLLRPAKKRGHAQIIDLWYPYHPGTATAVEIRLNPDNPMAVFADGRTHGTPACAACHMVEAASWSLSHHSIAWHTLVKGKDHTNESCTGCHVTNPGQPGGWDGDPLSALVDVGCESCHGPSGPHDGVRTEPKDTCAGCHDAKHSVAFTYEKGLPLIDHYVAATLDEAGYRAAITQLHNGEKPRALLAFPEGVSGEAAQCVACHAEAVKSWQADPHAKALATLDHKKQPKGSRQDVACVRCHATPKVTAAIAPTTLDGYLESEGGVSCASCHGPAEQHLATGGAPGTIQGLGEECPVCVIEALCTACHTPAWDKGWDLDRKLPFAGHHGRAPAAPETGR